MTSRHRPPVITAVCGFFVFGAVASGLSLVMLLFPGSPLDSLWRLNPHAHRGFEAIGGWALLLMAAICAACMAAASGLWRRRRWGLWIAITILALNLVGDTVHATLEHDCRTLVGVPIGGLIMFYLLRKRSSFASGNTDS